MHRSGTSALARVLSLSGAELPSHLVPPQSGLPGDANSVTGFWESAPLLELHRQAFASAGSRWDDPYDLPPSWFETGIARTFGVRLAETLAAEFGEAPLFVAKDPRISRLAPLWTVALRELDAEPCWLIAVRNPLDVAESLRQRDGFPPAKSMLLWLTYSLAAERHTRGRPRLFVRYDDLLDSWRGVVMRVENHFALRLPRRAHLAGVEIDAFLDRALRHHASPPGDLARRGDVADWIKAAFQWLLQAADGRPVAEDALDEIHGALSRAESVLGPLGAALERDNETLRQREGELAAEVERLRQEAAEAARVTATWQAAANARQEELARAGAKLAQAGAELAAIAARREEEVAEAAAHAGELQAQLDENRAAHERLAGDLEAARIQAAAREEELCGTIERLRSEKQARAAEPARARVRTLAFFLPQYHPIPENDAWWGRGFTDWTNVASAAPCFPGHRHPLLPSELGFYDLRVPEVRVRQAELAKAHGIDGFCYYYYWFAGRKLLERPLEEIVTSGEPDFPFCICWANENWTRRWDGEDDSVLIAQQHSPQSDQRFIEEILPLLRDRRYVTRNGEPVLLVYRADLIADPLLTTTLWRETARRAGLPGLHLCAVWRVDDPRLIGFDAVVEFQPHHFPHVQVTSRVREQAPGFEGKAFDYAAGVAAVAALGEPGFPVYRGVMPGWDNTPRRGSRARIFVNSSPELYGSWLEAVVRETRQRPGVEDRFVFINAWNEWAEGATLEPSLACGRAYLESTRRALLAAASNEQARLTLSPAERGKPLPWHGHMERQRKEEEATAGAEAAATKVREDELALRGLLALEQRPSAPARELWLNRWYGAAALAKLPVWVLGLRLPSRWRWWRQARAIARSGLFDAEHYARRYPEIARTGIDPVYHYVRFGGAEGRDPNRFFDGCRYLGQWPGLASGGENPLLHYLARARQATSSLASLGPAARAPDAAVASRPAAVPWRRNDAYARSRRRGDRAVLVVSHDAARAGSQLILLETIEHLARRPGLEVFVLLLAGGELVGEFERRVHTLELPRLTAMCGGSTGDAIEAVLADLAPRRPLLALCNTAASSAVAVACGRFDLPVLSMVYELPTSVESVLGRQALLDTVASSRRVLVPSRFVREALVARYDLDPGKLVALHTGAFAWDRSEGWRERCRGRVLAELELPDDTFLVLGCGTIHHRKGTDLFVQVAREVRDVTGDGGRLTFLWVGPDQLSPLFRQWCEHDVAAAGLAGMVRFVGGRSSMGDYFGAADAFALTSREDPFPMVALEAMARGIPVVGFEGAGGVGEALEGGAGVLVPYLDVKGMARSLVAFCEAPHYRAEVGAKARQAIESRFGWEGYVDQLIAILCREFGYLPSPAAGALPDHALASP